MKKLFYTGIFAVLLGVGHEVAGADTPTRVFKLNIKEDISPAAWRKTQKAFEEADSARAAVILLHLNTYGGTLQDADSIRTKIQTCRLPVYVFIDNNAASAGALISIACDSIYMRPGATIGAASVVDQSGQKLPDKYQSYMRGIMRSTAQAHGKRTTVQYGDTVEQWFRNPDIAEAMVDESVYIPGLIDSTKILSFTPDEAMQYGYCEGVAENIDEVMHHIGITHYEIIEYKPSMLEKIIGFLLNPVIHGLLIMLIIGGIYFELQTPGIGFPLIAAIVGALLYFAPLYLEGLAENWEIILFTGGLALIALEIFVIPGFGIAGVTGIVCCLCGLILSLLDNVVFDFSGIRSDQIMRAILTVTVSAAGGLFLALWGGHKLFTARSGLLKNLALLAVESPEQGYISVDVELLQLQGQRGKTISLLRPSGKVIINNHIYDAVSLYGDALEPNTEIEVLKVESAQLYVRKSNS